MHTLGRLGLVGLLTTTVAWGMALAQTDSATIVEGSVFNRGTGVPLGGASVTAFAIPDYLGEPFPIARSTTDRNGLYTLDFTTLNRPGFSGDPVM